MWDSICHVASAWAVSCRFSSPGCLLLLSHRQGFPSASSAFSDASFLSTLPHHPLQPCLSLSFLSVDPMHPPEAALSTPSVSGPVLSERPSSKGENQLREGQHCPHSHNRLISFTGTPAGQQRSLVQISSQTLRGNKVVKQFLEGCA